MENKKHCLVAWTQKGQIRMIPSLINELAEPYRERIAEVETKYPHKDNEVAWLLAQSRAHEDFARFLERLGRPNEAYQEFENAALVCTFGEDKGWLYGEECKKESRPLLYRFLAMHRECLDLTKGSKVLGIWYDMGLLRKTFRSVIRADEDERQASEGYDMNSPARKPILSKNMA